MGFVKATNQSAFLKMGLFGFQGSGKTRTRGSLRMGITPPLESRKSSGDDSARAHPGVVAIGRSSLPREEERHLT